MIKPNIQSIALLICLAFGHEDIFADAEAKQRPNIVFILADDLGWAELGCYGNHFNETPHDTVSKPGPRRRRW